MGEGAVTFAMTVPHAPGEDCRTVHERLRLARSAFWTLTSYRRFRKRWGVIGPVWGLDWTVGESGAHPHTHGVLFLERPLDAADVAEFNAEWFACWQSACRSSGAGEPVSFANYCEALRDGPSAAQYVFKAAMETNNTSGKEARGDGRRTPHDVLRDFGLYGDADDLALWLDYEAGSYGVTSRYFSRAVAERYGVDADVGLKDEDAIKLGAEGLDLEGCSVSVYVYVRAKRRAVLGLLRDSMASGGTGAVQETVRRLALCDPGSEAAAVYRLSDEQLAAVLGDAVTGDLDA
jgi:hypothetical protein